MYAILHKMYFNNVIAFMILIIIEIIINPEAKYYIGSVVGTYYLSKVITNVSV